MKKILIKCRQVNLDLANKLMQNRQTTKQTGIILFLYQKRVNGKK